MPSAVVGRQWPALSPTKKTPSSIAGRSSCGIQLPCQRSAGTPTSRGELQRRLLDVVARVERADADAQLAVGGKRPRVARADVLRVDPQLEVVAAGVRVDLQPARQARLGRLDVRARAEDPPPAERVDDQRRAQVAAVGVDGEARPPVDLRRLERARALRLRAQQRADAAVVERRERPRQLPAQRAPGRVDDEVARTSAGSASIEARGARATPSAPRRRDVWRSPIS